MRRRDLSKKRTKSPGQPGDPLQGFGTATTAHELPRELRKWTGFLLHRVSEVARILYSARIAKIALRPHDVGILQLLSAQGAIVQARLCDMLGVDKAAMVYDLNRLEDAGMVERRNHPDDGRAFVVYLKPEGLARLKLAERVNKAVSVELFHALSASEERELHRLLAKVAESHPADDRNTQSPANSRSKGLTARVGPDRSARKPHAAVVTDSRDG